jgi:riboflavin transporter FmnP
MNTRAIAVTIAFTALTIVLNPVRIPTFYWPGFFYRLWEIPIVVAFLLFGPRIGVSVAVLNVLAQIMLFPVSGGVVAYPWGLVATLTMLLGVYLAYKIFSRRPQQDKTLFGAKPVLYFTSLGIAFRAAIMPFVDYAVYHSLLPLALGQSFTEAYVISLIPAIVLFNITVPLYTVPIGYLIARKLGKSLKLDSSFKLYM